MVEEIVDFFDENYKKVGEAGKKKTRAEGLWVHSFHCWIVSTKGTPSMLLQKRSSKKALFPDCLDISAAGHLHTGEAVADGVREIEEEIGLHVVYDELISLGVKMDVAKIGNIINRQFANVFLYQFDGDIDDLDLDAVELDGMLMMPVKDGLDLFSGKVPSVSVSGIEKDDDGQWGRITKQVSPRDFIPRVDPYYYKMFINADLLLNGYSHLSI